MANSIISKVYLIDTPLKNDYKDTFYFDSLSSQQAYFNGKVKKTYTNVSYLRRDHIIKLNVHYDEICGCNYLMFQNTAYSNKWIYCFIKDSKYISDGVTELEIETDVMQTYMFDYEIKESFVEREHVTDDTIGKHTIPEGLEYGDYICNKTNNDGLDDSLIVAVAYHDLPEEGTTLNVEGGNLHGIYTSAIYTLGEMNEAGIKGINDILNKFDVSAKSDAVSSVFMVPKWIAGDIDGGKTIKPGTGSTNLPIVKSCSVSKLSTLNGYTPKNKKLLCYPYYYLYASNGCGGNAIYQPELCSDSKFNFTVHGSLTPGCSIKLLPLNYNGILEAHDYGLTGGKFPICSWISDTYTNWLTQNSLNQAQAGLSGLASIAAGGVMALTGAGLLPGLGMMVGGAVSIGNSMLQKHNASLVPDQARGNTNSGDVITGMKANKFMFYSMTIKQEYAKCIDDYMSMFGYKVNDLKIPNKNHRSNWWYTKTNGINIVGEITNNDLQKIRNCYDQGITFWKNPANIYNYNLDNSII